MTNNIQDPLQTFRAGVRTLPVSEIKGPALQHIKDALSESRDIVEVLVYPDEHYIFNNASGNLVLDIENCSWVAESTPDNLADLEAILYMWAKEDPQHSDECLARQFCAGLAQQLTPEEMAQVLERLPEYQNKGLCPSQDFVDANMVMLDAYQYLAWSTKVGPTTEGVMAAFGRAWEIAMANRYFVGHILPDSASGGGAKPNTGANATVAAQPQVVTEGSRWQHQNGNTYTVELLANVDSERPEYPVTVVYRGDNGKVWAKSMDNFLSKMRPV